MKQIIALVFLLVLALSVSVTVYRSMGFRDVLICVGAAFAGLFIGSAFVLSIAVLIERVLL